MDEISGNSTPAPKLLMAAIGSVAMMAIYWISRGELFIDKDGHAVSLGMMTVAHWPFALLTLGPVFLCIVMSFIRKELRRKAVMLILLAATVAGFYFIAGSNMGLVAGRLICVVVVVAVIAACASSGMRMLRFIFGSSYGLSVKEIVLVAIGLGIIKLHIAILLLGSVGLMSQWTAIILISLMLLSGIKFLREIVPLAIKGFVDDASEMPQAGWAALGLLLAVFIQLLPAAFIPPAAYDIIEYHAQLAREYYDAGAISFLSHNMFSGFPQLSEMLTYFSFNLAGGYHGAELSHSWGIWIAKLLNFSFLPLMLGGMTLAVRRLAGGGKVGLAVGLVAAGLALCSLATLSYSIILYVEVAMAAFTILALLALVGAWQSEDNFLFRRFALLAGLFAGGAACCKYTGLVFVGAPVALLIFMMHNRIVRRERIIAAVIAGLACWVVLSPWLVRNMLSTGNPVYPLFSQRIPTRDWSEDQAERFRLAHRPEYVKRGEKTFTFQEFLRDGYRLTIGGSREMFGEPVTGTELGALALLFLPCIICLRRREDWVRALLLCGWCLVILVAWFNFTHRVERFFHVGYVLLAVVSGIGLSSLMKSAYRHEGEDDGCGYGWRLLLTELLGIMGVALSGMAATVILAGIFLAPYKNNPATGEMHPVLEIASGEASPGGMLKNYINNWSLREYMLRNEDAKVLLVGSADPFWLPSKRYSYAVVFNKHPFFEALKMANDSRELKENLRKHGYTHIYINWPELARLYCTYYKAYRMDEKHQFILNDLLTVRCLGYTILSNRWDVGNLRSGWIRQFIDENKVLFVDRIPTGRYAMAAYELFDLED